MLFQRLARLLWHPHQRLWNWRLAKRVRGLPGGKLLERVLVVADSVLLAVRVLHQPSKASVLARARVLYVDCGVHVDGLQIEAVHRWFGNRVATLDVLAFEAHPTHHAAAVERLRAVPADIRQAAVVGPGHGPTVTLHLSGSEGKGDSLFAERGRTGSLEVPAVRLSDHLPVDSTFDAVILRMNIEGAEEFVIDDLVAADALHKVCGFYGMWDDLSKIDPERDIVFRRRLETLGIRPLTFNDRDFANPDWPVVSTPRISARIRLWAIKHDMAGRIAEGVLHRAA